MEKILRKYKIGDNEGFLAICVDSKNLAFISNEQMENSERGQELLNEFKLKCALPSPSFVVII